MVLTRSIVYAPFAVTDCVDCHCCPNDAGRDLRGVPKHRPTGQRDREGHSREFRLRFRYGKSVFALPYQQITNTQVVEPDGKHLWKVPVPTLGKGSRLLTITFKDGDESRMLTFKAPAYTVSHLLSTIDDRRQTPKTASVSASASAKASVTETPEVWWGDRYWRTNRNKAKWPEGETQGVSAATKE
jgi:hypothetical protein